MNATYVWYHLGAIATIGSVGGALTLGLHAFLDRREGRNQKPAEQDTTTDLGGFFEPEQPPADPWADADPWTVDEITAAKDTLDVIRAFARVGFDEIPKPESHLADDALPPLLFDGLTAEYRQVNPTVAGHTQTWMLPSYDDDAIRNPYRAWNGFTVPELEPVRVPAQRTGDES